MNQRSNSYSRSFIILSSIFISALLTANIIAVKIISIAGKTLPAGVIIFPISYILGDVITEIYGYKKTRLVIILGFLCNLLMVAGIIAAQKLPAAPFWNYQESFDTILGFTPRLLVASFIGYLIGSLSNAATMQKIKKLTHGKYLWFRTISSTIIGEGLDSALFISIAFWNQISTKSIFQMIIAQWIFKTTYESIITPITYGTVRWLEKRESENYNLKSKNV
jgi:hypothetical protein